MIRIKQAAKAIAILLVSSCLLTPSAAAGQHRKRPAAGKAAVVEMKLPPDQQDALGLLRRLAIELKSEPDRLASALLQAQTADVLWKFDEPVAVAVFRAAFDTARQPAAESSSVAAPSDAERSELLRRQAVVIKEVLRLYGSHDPKSAEVWLKQLEAERTAEAQPATAASSSQQTELLAQLALELTSTDTAKAQQLGLLSLAGREMPEAFGRLLFALNNHDRNLSDTLFRAALAAMRRNGFKYSTALFSLSNYVFDQQGKISPEAETSDGQLLIAYFLDAGDSCLNLWRETQQAGGETLSESSAQFYSFYASYALPIIELNAPDKQAQARRLLNELSQGVGQTQRQQVEQLSSARHRQMSLYNGDSSDVDSHLEQIEKETDAATRDIMRRQTAIGLMRSDSARALSIAAKIEDPTLRAQTEDDINLVSLSSKLGERDYDEARTTALKLNEPNLKAKLLAEVAGVALTKSKDISRASELLAEARALSLKSENAPAQIEALLFIAGQYSKFDVVRSFEVLSDTIKILNSLNTSSTGFKSNLTRKPALRIVAITAINGKELTTGQATTLDALNFKELAPLVKQDYARARAVGEKIDNKLMRAKFLIAIAGNALE